MHWEASQGSEASRGSHRAGGAGWLREVNEESQEGELLGQKVLEGKVLQRPGRGMVGKQGWMVAQPHLGLGGGE